MSQGTDGLGPAGRLGLSAGQVVMELGVDADVDESLRTGIAEIT